MTRLEHVNVTVTDIDATSAWLENVFGWRTRWRGGSIHGGETAHVGGDTFYVALYCPPKPPGAVDGESYFQVGALNHIAVVVEDLDDAEARTQAAGFAPHSHADYEPGQRFYFRDSDGIEWEVVSYG